MDNEDVKEDVSSTSDAAVSDLSSFKFEGEITDLFKTKQHSPFTLPEIPVLVKNDLPPKLFYSLADAAKIAKCDSKDLLHYAGLGKIRLHIPVPENCHLQVRNSLNGALGIERAYDVELLSLHQGDCRKIEFHGRAVQSSFSTGWYIDGYGYAHLQFKTRVDQDIGGSTEIGLTWEVCLGDSVSPVELSVERLIVMSFDLKNFLDGTYKAEDQSEQPEQAPVDHEFKSEKLRQMNIAAATFWKNANPNDKDTFPLNSEVSAWLQERKMSKNQADIAAAILRPHFAEHGRRGTRD